MGLYRTGIKSIFGGFENMSLIEQFRELLENVSIYNVYVEYDTTPLCSRPEYFLTVGINSEECSYNIQNTQDGFMKDRITFVVTMLSPPTATASQLDTYFDNNILRPVAKSDTFNLVSYKKERPNYSKYLDKVELVSSFVVECVANLGD
jgi:hypothetical protein